MQSLSFEIFWILIAQNELFMQAFDTPDGLVEDDFLHFGLYQIKGTLLLDQLIVELMKKSCNLFWHLLQTPTKTVPKSPISLNLAKIRTFLEGIRAEYDFSNFFFSYSSYY